MHITRMIGLWLGYRAVKKLWQCVKPFQHYTGISYPAISNTAAESSAHRYNLKKKFCSVLVRFVYNFSIVICHLFSLTSISVIICVCWWYNVLFSCLQRRYDIYQELFTTACISHVSCAASREDCPRRHAADCTKPRFPKHCVLVL